VAGVLACVLTRPEANVLAIAVLGGAVVRGRMRALVPTWIACGVIAVVRLALGGGSPLRSLGRYPESPAYTPLRILELVAEHAGLLLLVSGIVPLCAVVIYALTRPADPAVRSLLAVILTLAAASVLETGVFAAGHTDGLVERNLLFVLPSLFVGFSLWLGRGAPRPRWRTLGIAAAAFVGLIALPIGALATSDAVADNPSLVPLIDVSSPQAYGLTALAAGVACALLVWLPRRLVWLLPVALGAVLLVVSASAAREFADQSRAVQRALVGDDPEAIDRFAFGHSAFATYLYDGSPAWKLVWMELLRNESIRDVLDLTPTRVPGPLPQSQLKVLGDDGRLELVDGGDFSADMFVAPEGMTLKGTKLVTKPGSGSVPGFVLWEVDWPPRVTTWRQGVLPNGDVGSSGTATLDVYDCGRGTFHLLAVGRDDTKLTLARDGTTVATYDLWPRGVWEQTIPTEAGSGRCTFSLSSGSLVHLEDFSWTPAR
jgi:hypothetical protein